MVPVRSQMFASGAFSILVSVLRPAQPGDLSCSGNLDGQQRLIVKGRFLPKGFENVIRRYVNECVLPPKPLP